MLLEGSALLVTTYFTCSTFNHYNFLEGLPYMQAFCAPACFLLTCYMHESRTETSEWCSKGTPRKLTNLVPSVRDHRCAVSRQQSFPARYLVLPNNLLLFFFFDATSGWVSKVTPQNLCRWRSIRGCDIMPGTLFCLSSTRLGLIVKVWVWG